MSSHGPDHGGSVTATREKPITMEKIDNDAGFKSFLKTLSEEEKTEMSDPDVSEEKVREVYERYRVRGEVVNQVRRFFEARMKQRFTKLESIPEINSLIESKIDQLSKTPEGLEALKKILNGVKNYELLQKENNEKEKLIKKKVVMFGGEEALRNRVAVLEEAVNGEKKYRIPGTRIGFGKTDRKKEAIGLAFSEFGIREDKLKERLRDFREVVNGLDDLKELKRKNEEVMLGLLNDHMEAEELHRQVEETINIVLEKKLSLSSEDRDVIGALELHDQVVENSIENADYAQNLRVDKADIIAEVEEHVNKIIDKRMQEYNDADPQNNEFTILKRDLEQLVGKHSVVREKLIENLEKRVQSQPGMDVDKKYTVNRIIKALKGQ